MRFAAVVPTRNRAHTADRAVRTFLSALRRTGLASAVTIAVADDSDDAAESALLVGLMREMAATHNARIDLVGHALGARGIFGGPGAARNRALGRLRETVPDAEVTVMFDDDVVFDDTHYRGVTLRCDGARLLREAVGGVRRSPNGGGMRLHWTTGPLDTGTRPARTVSWSRRSTCHASARPRRG